MDQSRSGVPLKGTAWPPLVLGESLPRWVRVRDLAITLAAWALVLWWTRGAFFLLWDWLRYPMFELTTTRAPDWPRIWKALAPFFGLAALLSAWLVYWSHKRRRILQQREDAAQPAPLALATHAARFGLGPEDVGVLRQRRVAVVRFDNGIIERNFGQ